MGLWRGLFIWTCLFVDFRMGRFLLALKFVASVYGMKVVFIVYVLICFACLGFGRCYDLLII